MSSFKSSFLSLSVETFFGYALLDFLPHLSLFIVDLLTFPPKTFPIEARVKPVAYDKGSYGFSFGGAPLYGGRLILFREVMAFSASSSPVSVSGRRWLLQHRDR
ncbi:hypothetical protein F2Q69_00045842 [Brassica cretica]|uniref:Uncharacterized protein n=1 Tax=Brassica cretica TaxID=69181 RepID=A0A8S9NGN1_BRACR|nr:hypothetical protein F2Q69_00045842 [Brassica cretica]